MKCDNKFTLPQLRFLEKNCWKCRKTVRITVTAAFLIYNSTGLCAQDQTNHIALYQVGKTTVFRAADFTGVQYRQDKRNNAASIEFELTAKMSNQIAAFTEALVGKSMVSVLNNEIGADNITVRSKITGSVPLNYYGPNSDSFRQRVEQFKEAQQRVTEKKILMMWFEKKGKFNLGQEDIRSRKSNENTVEIQLSKSVLQKWKRDSVDLLNSKWLLSIKNRVIAGWEKISINSTGLMKIKDIDQHSAAAIISEASANKARH